MREFHLRLKLSVLDERLTKLERLTKELQKPAPVEAPAWPSGYLPG